MAIKQRPGERVVCLCIQLTDRDDQDKHIWQLINALLEDETIECEMFWDNTPEVRTPVPERPYIMLTK